MNRLTKYECSRIIGIRATQISMNAPALVEVPTEHQSNCFLIAALELKAGLLDIIVRRPIPGGRCYEVNVTDLVVPDDLDVFVRMHMKTDRR